MLNSLLCGIILLFGSSTAFLQCNSSLPHAYGFSQGSYERVGAVTNGHTTIFFGSQLLVDILDWSTNTWSTHYLSMAREGIVAVAVGNLILFTGGRLSSGSVNIVDIYNVVDKSWGISQMSASRYLHTATSRGQIALIAGGIGNNAYTTIDIFDATSRTWTADLLSAPRSDLSSTTVGNLAIFAGGATNQELSNVVDIYNYETKQKSVAYLSQRRESISATSVGNYALFAGGSVSKNPNGDSSDVVDIFNFATFEWTNSSRLSSGRQRFAATSVGNYAIFAGGYPINGDRCTNVVDIFNSLNGQWTTSVLSQPRDSLGATTYGNLALFSGGRSNDEYSKVLDIFDFGNNYCVTLNTTQSTSQSATTEVSNKSTSEVSSMTQKSQIQDQQLKQVFPLLLLSSLIT